MNERIYGCIFVGLFALGIICFWYFFHMMGYKFRKDAQYNYLLLTPVLVVAIVAGWASSTLFGWDE